ncbi:GNAT family N-acetyltransferase [Sphingobacterium siyangense]|uniref:GNAT family N-acetyltransferase n=1 Tax=Sphingobacterium siyangense TaxID=459529 RepID=UPI001965085F|nr:GNAT family N-acetyltransferase [Sphingobacterium siyangense]QRY55643.1 GNAT family N-acetyltransferase [Sphingobacterium siyangense]
MIPIVYRRAMESDLTFLLDLRLKTMTQHLIAAALPTTRDSHLQRIKYKFEHAAIIEYNHIPIGLLKTEKGRAHIELIQIQIAPRYQGKGLGKKILKDLIDEAIYEGKSISLHVLKTNKAQKLYFSLGFEIIGEDEHSYHMKYSNKDKILKNRSAL